MNFSNAKLDLGVDHQGDQIQTALIPIAYVAGHYETFESCLAAVKKDGMALEYVPQSLIKADSSIRRAAVEQNKIAACFVPSEILEN